MKLPAQENEKQSLAFGGQALIEGVMIRSHKHLVICVRQPNNEILTHIEEINSLSEKHWVLRLPFLRGIIALFETLYLGVKGIFFSANATLDEEEEFTYKEFLITIVMALVLASFFLIVPFLLTALLNLRGLVFNIVEAIVRLTFFLLYLALVSMWGEFRRILQYHGAEHKAINAHEAGSSLNVSDIKKFPRLHSRCGTSFIFVVVFVSILLFSLMPDLGFTARLAYRLVLVPAIGAISYELLKLSDKHKDSAIMRFLTIPGLAFQRLATKEPDDDMVEVAAKAVMEIRRLSSSLQTSSSNNRSANAHV